MKIIKRISLGLLGIIVLASFGGHFYFDKNPPADNYLIVSGTSRNIVIKWVANGDNPYGAMLLPVKIKGIKKTLYMQLDFGSPTTMFYKKSLQSIPLDLTDGVSLNKHSNHIALDFNIKRMVVASKIFRLLDYGDNIDFENPKAENIVGTIGTDLLEKRIITLNFKNGVCSFTNRVHKDGFAEFEFKKRRILIPARIGNENVKLMYDSGASGYQLITSKDNWENYRIRTGKVMSENVNSWGHTLSITSAPSNKEIQFGATKLRLSEVTYIEGTSTMINSQLKLSGMQGMIGNKLFLNNTIILDCKNGRFRVE